MTSDPQRSACRERLGVLAQKLRERADELEARRDSRCVFTRTYAVMTLRLAQWIEKDETTEPQWVTDLAEAFGGRYFEALSEFDAGRSRSPAWEAVFRAITTQRTSVIEDLALPMTAHIVRDLPYALLDVGFLEHGGARIHDFHAVNEVMAECVDEIQEQMRTRYAPTIGFLDELTRHSDEIVTNYGVRLSRGVAWYNAMRLADRASHDAAAKSIEDSPCHVVRSMVTNPHLGLRVVFRLLRIVVSYHRRWPAAEQH
jgi:hypothetical protein